jgi:hypothetical protein
LFFIQTEIIPLLSKTEKVLHLLKKRRNKLKTLITLLLITVPVFAHAEDKFLYFAHAAYLRCPTASDPTWQIQGKVDGPWIQAVMLADGGVTSVSADQQTFAYWGKWTMKDASGKVLMAAHCDGNSLTSAIPGSPNAPWWETCQIDSGSGQYRSYVGRQLLSAGFAPPQDCRNNESFISGYKILDTAN